MEKLERTENIAGRSNGKEESYKIEKWNNKFEEMTVERNEKNTQLILDGALSAAKFW